VDWGFPLGGGGHREKGGRDTGFMGASARVWASGRTAENDLGWRGTHPWAPAR
jgi:hypothetical protein